MSAPMAVPDLLTEALDVLCPMHLRIDHEGRVLHAGPTLRKLRPDAEWLGAEFFDHFDILRPRHIGTVEGLFRNAGQKLHLRLRDDSGTGVKGVLMSWPDGAILNMSFGIEIVDAVGRYDLSAADFAATDLTVEMLFLVEAKSAALEESRKLNLRLQGAKIAAEEQAFTDTLTGLKNRRALDHVLARLVDGGQSFAMMHIDLDFFKAVNDTMGHAAGDLVLQNVARVLVAETRGDDLVARVGGDEFVLILNNLVDPGKLDQIARRIIRGLEEPVLYDGTPCQISGSIGTTISTLYAKPTADRMLADADEALYASKRGGRGRHTMFERRVGDRRAG